MTLGGSYCGAFQVGGGAFQVGAFQSDADPIASESSAPDAIAQATNSDTAGGYVVHEGGADFESWWASVPRFPITGVAKIRPVRAECHVASVKAQGVDNRSRAQLLIMAWLLLFDDGADRRDG